MQAIEVPLFCVVTSYLQLAILLVVGHVRNLLGRILGSKYDNDIVNKPGFAPLMSTQELFYMHRIFNRVKHVFYCPILTAPATKFVVADRVTNDGGMTFERTGETRKCVNLGSYNYLGFADDWMETCGKRVLPTVRKYGCAMVGADQEFGQTPLHRELELACARMVGKRDAMVFGMGYGTNTGALPGLLGRGDLIISDALNHASIVNGVRSSGAAVAVFKHNDLKSLERVLRLKIAQGQPGKKGCGWRKVFVAVEGIYSMEGDIVDLRGVVDIAKKYKAYIYVDEAHSVGAMGQNGRGICEYCGVDPSEIDILMGTFSKSFGGIGGYIAADTEILDKVREYSANKQYATSMSPIVAQQVLTTLRIITGEDGTSLGQQKLRSLRENANYFRRRIEEMGCIALGDEDSPVVPVMLYSMSKVAEFGRECMKRGVAAVTVTFPATPLLLGRARFCLSAAHTREDLDFVLDVIEEVAGICHVRFQKHLCG